MSDQPSCSTTGDGVSPVRKNPRGKVTHFFIILLLILQGFKPILNTDFEHRLRLLKTEIDIETVNKIDKNYTDF